MRDGSEKYLGYERILKEEPTGFEDKPNEEIFEHPPPRKLFTSSRNRLTLGGTILPRLAKSHVSKQQNTESKRHG